MIPLLRSFLERPEESISEISNEASLQHELGFFLRKHGFKVKFEQPYSVASVQGSTRKPKKELDLLVFDGEIKTAIELKAPLAGRVPESMYDFCADIEFVEALLRQGVADKGICILVTNNRQFWTLGKEGIYDYFRSKKILNGSISKPTGMKDSCVILKGKYNLNECWIDLGEGSVMTGGRYLLIEIIKS